MPRKSKNHRGTAPTQRQLRVGEEIRHALSSVLSRGDLYHKPLEGVSITISEVRVSVDLRHAFAFVIPLGGKNTLEIVKELKVVRPYLRSRLREYLRLKWLPELHFEPDQSFDEAHRIESLLSLDRVRQDLPRTAS